ncbi:hypothetical protein [Mucilaginibacter sp. CSA2-8R]|uniref:hypothetical protein n=1 Tax=Mucilaginibacter sp. CSA2-8R TaxID=3141542 RepID=UPI00315CE410
MKIITDTSPELVQNSINASATFQNPLHELETYVARSQNPKLTDSFRKFKEALSEPGGELNNRTNTRTAKPLTATKLPEFEDRSYMAMSSLFSANVKQR